MLWNYAENLQENTNAEVLCNFIEITLWHVCIFSEHFSSRILLNSCFWKFETLSQTAITCHLQNLIVSVLLNFDGLYKDKVNEKLWYEILLEKKQISNKYCRGSQISSYSVKIINEQKDDKNNTFSFGKVKEDQNQEKDSCFHWHHLRH